MVCVEIRVMRKDKKQAASDVAAILRALKENNADHVERSAGEPLRLAYSASTK